MSKGIFPKNNQFCFGTSLKVNGCCFVRSYHFIKKYTPGNHTTDFGNISYRKNAFFRALPEKGGGGPCPNLSFIYIQHISSENRIPKTIWYFGAPWCGQWFLWRERCWVTLKVKVVKIWNVLSCNKASENTFIALGEQCVFSIAALHYMGLGGFIDAKEKGKDNISLYGARRYT